MIIEDFKKNLAEINSVRESRIRKTISSSLPFEQNKEKFIKVGFDLYKSDPNYLDDREFWKISETEEGRFFTRLSEDNVTTPVVNKTGWAIIENEKNASLVFAYKSNPLFSICVTDLDCDAKLLGFVKQAIVQNIIADNKYVVDLITNFAKDREEFIRHDYPEIFS